MIADLFTYMDVAIIVLLLIAGIMGAIKGFANLFFSLVSLVLVVVLAGFFCDEVATWISPVFGDTIQDSIRELVVNNDIEGLFTTTQDWGTLTNSQTTQILAHLGLPEFVANIVAPSFTETISGFGTCVLADALPPLLTQWTLNVICFVAMTLIIGIILVLIKNAVFKALQKPGLSALDRIFGFVVSTVYAYAVISVLLVLFMTFAADLGFLSDVQQFIVEQAELSLTGQVPVFHYMFNYNFIGDWVIQLLTQAIA